MRKKFLNSNLSTKNKAKINKMKLIYKPISIYQKKLRLEKKPKKNTFKEFLSQLPKQFRMKRINIKKKKVLS